MAPPRGRVSLVCLPALSYSKCGGCLWRRHAGELVVRVPGLPGVLYQCIGALGQAAERVVFVQRAFACRVAAGYALAQRVVALPLGAGLLFPQVLGDGGLSAPLVVLVAFLVGGVVDGVSKPASAVPPAPYSWFGWSGRRGWWCGWGGRCCRIGCGCLGLRLPGRQGFDDAAGLVVAGGVCAAFGAGGLGFAAPCVVAVAGGVAQGVGAAQQVACRVVGEAPASLAAVAEAVGDLDEVACAVVAVVFGEGVRAFAVARSPGLAGGGDAQGVGVPGLASLQVVGVAFLAAVGVDGVQGLARSVVLGGGGVAAGVALLDAVQGVGQDEALGVVDLGALEVARRLGVDGVAFAQALVFDAVVGGKAGFVGDAGDPRGLRGADAGGAGVGGGARPRAGADAGKAGAAGDGARLAHVAEFSAGTQRVDAAGDLAAAVVLVAPGVAEQVGDGVQAAGAASAAPAVAYEARGLLAVGDLGGAALAVVGEAEDGAALVVADADEACLAVVLEADLHARRVAVAEDAPVFGVVDAVACLVVPAPAAGLAVA
ncbi:hypothetical protein FQR65_LT08006 [Abscondita terminalis]|nr:hypothetical protein FQR65_LT08006 [Abscondita terminalis]